MKKAFILLAEGFEEVEAITPIDFLRRAGIDVTIAGIDGEIITGSHGIRVKADSRVDELSPEDFDAAVIPGGMPGAENVFASEPARALITGINDQGGLIAAICAAPAVVLDPLGILKNRKASCYPGFEKRFKDARYVDERVVLDGRILTSCGPGCAADFSFEIIRYLLDSGTAETIRQKTLH